MTVLPAEIYEHILSYLPFTNLLPLRRVSHLFDTIIFHLLSHPTSYLTSWSLILASSTGIQLSIPLSPTSTRPATSWREIYTRPYIFSGPVSGISRKEYAQVLKLQFWDEKEGEYVATRNAECRTRCCGLCDVTVWPWSTLPLSRQGPLGEVITWRDLYKVDLWESAWDEALLQRKRVEQHIGAAWHNAANAGPPIIQLQHVAIGNHQGGGVGTINIYMGTPVQMTEQGYIAVQGVPGTSFSPNRIRVALSYSAICGFLVLQRRKARFERGQIGFDPVEMAIQDPKIKEAIVQARVGCGCKLVDWEHEDLGIKVIRLDDSESNSFDGFR